MPFAFLEAAHPCEFDLIEARLFNLVESLDRLRPWLRAQIFLDQRHQHALLVFAEFAVSNAFVLMDRGLALIAGQDVVGRGSVDHSFCPLRWCYRLNQRSPDVYYAADH